MKQVQKKVCLFLAAAMLLAMLPVFSFAQVREQGNFTGGAHYEVDTNGVVAITGVGSVDAGYFEARSDIMMVVVANYITIGEEAFKGCDKLKTAQFGKSVKLGRAAFSECGSLTDVTFNDEGAAVIGDRAFWGCHQLCNLKLNRGVKEIGTYAFYDNSALQSVSVSGGLQTIGDFAFSDCENLTSVQLPEGLETIGAAAFYMCAFPYFDIPDTVTEIGHLAFDACFNLRSITIPESIETLGQSIFYQCHSLQSVQFPGTMQQISPWMFEDCPSLGSVTIPDSVTEIGSGAFSKCKGLVTVNLGAGLREIQSYAFKNCTSLRSVDLPAGVLNIGEEAFIGCTDLAAVSVPDSLREIGDKAFKDCAALSSFVLPASVSMIGAGAFNNTGALDRIYYKGSRDKWNTVANDAGVTPVFYECLLEDGVIYNSTKTTIQGVYDRSISSVTIPTTVAILQDHAFEECDNLAAVMIPASVISIGRGIFAGCDNLTVLRVAAGNQAYKNSGNCIVDRDSKALVAGCAASEIPTDGTVTSIGPGAFEGFEWITELTVPDAITEIGAEAFSRAGFVTVTLPTSVKTIREDAFSGCRYLRDVYYGGSAGQRGQMAISYGNDPLMTCTWHYAIAMEPLSEANITLSWTAKPYNGGVQKPAVTVKNAAGKTLTQGESYFVEFAGGCKTPGTYTAVINGMGNYEGSFEKTFRITKQTLTAANVTLSWSSKPYNGGVQKPTVTVRNAAGSAITEGTSYTVSYSANSVKPNTYTVTVTGKGNYTGTASKTYTIAKATLAASNITLSWSSKPYTGSAQKPTVTVRSAGGSTLTEGTSYTVSYSANSVKPNTYTVTVTGKGNYTGAASKNYTITKAALTSSNITLSWTSKPYNGSPQKPAVTVRSAGGSTLTEGTSYTVSYSANSVKPNTYTVTVTGKGNYTGAATKNYTITKATLASSNITLSWTSKPYNGSVQKPTVTVKSAAGSTLTEGTSYTVSYSAGSAKPNSYTVTVTGAGNYTGTVKKTYTITKAALASGNVTLSWTGKPYNGSVQQPTVTVRSAAGSILTEGTSYTVSYSADSKYPDSYMVIVTGAGNYTGTVTKTYTITKATIASSNVTLSWTSKPYNGSVQKPTVTVKNAAGSVITLNTSYTLSYSGNCKDKGTYTLTVTGAGNYTGAVSKTFTIK